jgi:hypothetical protein
MGRASLNPRQEYESCTDLKITVTQYVRHFTNGFYLGNKDIFEPRAAVSFDSSNMMRFL